MRGLRFCEDAFDVIRRARACTIDEAARFIVEERVGVVRRKILGAQVRMSAASEASEVGPIVDDDNRSKLLSDGCGGKNVCE